jgi:hypothetical protein
MLREKDRWHTSEYYLALTTTTVTFNRSAISWLLPGIFLGSFSIDSPLISVASPIIIGQTVQHSIICGLGQGGVKKRRGSDVVRFCADAEIDDARVDTAVALDILIFAAIATLTT